MGCSCHINAPCTWCMEYYVCEKCHEDKHINDSKRNEMGICEECVEEFNNEQEKGHEGEK